MRCCERPSNTTCSRSSGSCSRLEGILIYVQGPSTHIETDECAKAFFCCQRSLSTAVDVGGSCVLVTVPERCWRLAAPLCHSISLLAKFNSLTHINGTQVLVDVAIDLVQQVTNWCALGNEIVDNALHIKR